MADIHIERRAPSVWPWVLGLLVLAVLIWGLVEMFGTPDDLEDLESATQEAEVAPPSPAGVNGLAAVPAGGGYAVPAERTEAGAASRDTTQP